MSFKRLNCEFKLQDFNYKDNNNDDYDQKNKLTFNNIIKNYNQTFQLINQYDNKALLIKMKLGNIVHSFSLPLCLKSDLVTRCRPNCDCLTSLDIGMQIYKKGCVHSFHQFKNIIIGYINEQQTDPISRIAIEFNK
jgi:hypothetical protein